MSQTRIDSLIANYQNEKTDTSKLNILISIVDGYIHKAKYSKALPYADTAYELSHKIKAERKAAYICDELGIIYRYLGNYKNAAKYYFEALEYWYKTGNKKNEIKIYFDISSMLSDQSNFDMELEVLNHIKKIQEEDNDTVGIIQTKQLFASVYSSLCKKFVNLNDSIKANYYYQKVIYFTLDLLESYKRSNDPEAIASGYFSLAFILDKVNFCDDTAFIREERLLAGNYYSQSKRFYELSLDYHKKTNNELGVHSDEYYLGLYCKNQGNLNFESGDSILANQFYLLAASYFKKSLAGVEKDTLYHGIGNNCYQLGLVYYRLGELSIAQGYLNRSIDAFTTTGFKDGLKDALRALRDVYVANRNFEEGYATYVKYNVIIDSIADLSTKQQLEELNKRYETELKDQQIEIQNAELASEQAKKKYYTAGAVGVAAAGFLGFVAYRNNRKRRVASLRMKILRSQIEPHFVFNVLNSIREFIHENPQIAEDYLLKFSKLMRQVLELSAEEFITLDDEINMLKNYMDLEMLRKNNSFTYKIEADDALDMGELEIPPLILQPIIENAIKYGFSDQAPGILYIKISKTNSAMIYEIENYAIAVKLKSYTETSSKNPFGLKIIEERLNLLGKSAKNSGKLEFYKRENGAKVRLTIPIKQ